MRLNPTAHPFPRRRRNPAPLLALLGLSLLCPRPAAAQLPPLAGELVVTITSPSNGATVSGTIPVSASVTIVGDLLVAGVQFRVDGVNIGGEDTSSPYSVSWDTTTRSNGSHTLTAIARDSLGLTYASDPVTVTVSNADTTNPSVSITSPGNGATVSGTISITASASDNVGVAGVQFFVDGVARGAEDTSSPYAVSWDTTTASNGTHNLTARARDAAGNTTTSSAVTVTVSNADTTKPSVSITSPGNGATVSGTISITASASDNVGVAGVQFFVDGVARGAEDTSSPYAVSWDTTTAINGTHSLTARARDAAGNTATSSAVTVTVSNEPPPDTTPPTVSITSPSSGATVSGTVTVTASATDANGVTVVQFLVDGAELGRDTTAPYEATWDTTAAANGTHTLQARAQDPAGNIGESAVVTVTVSNAAPPPETGRLEETSATLAPAGTWAELTDAGAGATLSGGRAVFTSAAGATASFTFTGTGVSWIGLPCEVCGISRVFVDGALVATVDTFAPSRPAASSVLYTASGLPSGSHTLVVEVTGTQNPSSGGASVVVDAIDVEGGTAGGGGDVTRIEDNDPAVVYTGTWLSHTRSDVSGGTAVESLDPDGTAALTFDGTGVKWIGFRGPWAGIAQVFLDGTLVATVDTYAPTEQAQTVMYTASGLAAGVHTILIDVTMTSNPSAESTWVVVDAFDVTSGGGGGAAPPAAQRFEEASATLAPATAWFGLTSEMAGVTLSGDFAVLASDAGATARFTFTGTEVSWIGFKCEQCGIARVSLDGAVAGTVDTYAPSRPAASGVLFGTTGLAAGSHTLLIEVTGTRNASSAGAFIAVDAIDVR